jgi:hypothetical protein
MKRPGRTWLVTAAILLLIALVGTVVEQIGRHRDRTKYAQRGMSYDVGGRTIKHVLLWTR